MQCNGPVDTNDTNNKRTSCDQAKIILAFHEEGLSHERDEGRLSETGSRGAGRHNCMRIVQDGSEVGGSGTDIGWRSGWWWSADPLCSIILHFVNSVLSSYI